ncbi:MAG: hypothetical protein NC328_04565 [Muribaculum sp.]|nr:hypothetical protein [Muribaculum sp.]
MKRIYFLAAAAALAASATAETLDWNKIEHWTGYGSNKAALVIQFYTPGASNPGAIVWGFRWDPSQTVTGEEMMLKVAEESADLTLLTQHTGWMGRTFCGAGYALDSRTVLDNLDYDFDGASSDSNISFGFFTPNTAMGQTSCPADAYGMVLEAIDDAKTTHCIDHPLNDTAFGYPAYDYDWWKLKADAPANTYWNSGWYIDYWSFYTGTSMDDLNYSGRGMTSVELEDGDIHAWKCRPAVQGSPENSEWLAFNYSHFKGTTSAVDTIDAEEPAAPVYYRLDGTPAGFDPAPGIYVKVAGGKASKVVVK